MIFQFIRTVSLASAVYTTFVCRLNCGDILFNRLTALEKTREQHLTWNCWSKCRNQKNKIHRNFAIPKTSESTVKFRMFRTGCLTDVVRVTKRNGFLQFNEFCRALLFAYIPLCRLVSSMNSFRLLVISSASFSWTLTTFLNSWQRFAQNRKFNPPDWLTKRVLMVFFYNTFCIQSTIVAFDLLKFEIQLQQLL